MSLSAATIVGSIEMRSAAAETKARGLLPPTDDSDEALVARAGRGDRIAASAIVVRHSDRVFAVCRMMLRNTAEAEDATQDTFLRLWKAASRWRPMGAKFETWLLRIAKNACLDRLRRSGREIGDGEIPERADPQPGAEAVMIADERSAAVAAALGQLPERQRLAIVLCHYEEMTNIDAAAVLEVSVEALESLLARGRRALRASLAPRRDEFMEGAGHG